MTSDRKRRNTLADPERHEDRLKVLRIQLLQIRAIDLKKSFRQSMGAFTPYCIEKEIYLKEHGVELLPGRRAKLVDRHLSGEVAIGSHALAKYEGIAPGVTSRVRHVLPDLLAENQPWTLPRVWKCMKRMPAPVTAALFHSPGSKGARWTKRHQLDLNEVHDLGKTLSKKDHFALLVSLFREQQVLGDSQKCLELQWAIEDAITFRGLSYKKRDELLLDFALCNSVLAISWDDSVFMKSLKTITTRLANTPQSLGV